MYIFFFKQKTAYEMRISDWSSDVCSSDLSGLHHRIRRRRASAPAPARAACNAGPRSRRRFRSDGSIEQRLKIGRAHVLTPATNAHLVCRLLLEKKKNTTTPHTHSQTKTTTAAMPPIMSPS